MLKKESAEGCKQILVNRRACYLDTKMLMRFYSMTAGLIHFLSSKVSELNRNTRPQRIPPGNNGTKVIA